MQNTERASALTELREAELRATAGGGKSLTPEQVRAVRALSQFMADMDRIIANAYAKPSKGKSGGSIPLLIGI